RGGGVLARRRRRSRRHPARAHPQILRARAPTRGHGDGRDLARIRPPPQVPRPRRLNRRSTASARIAAMSPLRVLLNILWVVFGGFWMAFGWLIAAILMAITLIGLPWARSALNIAWYTLLPFGHTVVPRSEVTGREDLGTGPLGFIGNIIWLILAGWWLAL